MRRLRLDKIASSTRHLNLSREVMVDDAVPARAGIVIAGRVRGKKAVYNQLEDPSGRLLELDEGDAIAGVLGARRAILGYAGVVPSRVQRGDVLHVLNQGGVIGQCTSMNPDVGPPRELEVLGCVLRFPHLGERIGVPADIKDGAVPAREALDPDCPPVIAIVGTCMNAGKTTTAARIIRHLARGRGLKVAATKLTGVSLRRDTLAMLDRGASWAIDFGDAGYPSTAAGETPRIAKGLLTQLAEEEPDVIVAELGDGILGDYGVQDLLRDPDLRRVVKVWVMCANDPVAAWGAHRLFRDDYGLPIHVLAGPATDNEVGREFIRNHLGLAALNARTQEQELVERVAAVLRGEAAREPAPQ